MDTLLLKLLVTPLLIGAASQIAETAILGSAGAHDRRDGSRSRPDRAGAVRRRPDERAARHLSAVRRGARRLRPSSQRRRSGRAGVARAIDRPVRIYRLLSRAC